MREPALRRTGEPREADREAPPLTADGRPLRVLHCLWNGEVGGAERAVYLLVREQMNDPSIEPALLFGQARGPYWERAQDLGCTVISPGLPSGRSLHRVGRVTDAMRPFDLHHFHAAEPLLMLASLPTRGTRRVYTHRGGSTRYAWRRRLRYALTGALLRRSFHGYSANTGHAARFAADLLGLDSDRVRVTYNGLDFGLLDPAEPAHQVRHRWGLPGDAFVLGTAAHLRSWKRIDRLVSAVAAIADPAVRLLVVGDGPDRARLESLTAELGVLDRVVFAGLQRQIGDFLQVMDLFSLPSTSLESFGNAAVEAMAMGLPTIVFSDSPGLLEHVDGGETGFVVHDQAELEHTIRRVAADGADAVEVGARGAAAVRERYTPANAAARYRSLYASALGRG